MNQSPLRIYACALTVVAAVSVSCYAVDTTGLTHSEVPTGIDDSYLDTIVMLHAIDVQAIKSTSGVAFPSASTTIGLSRIERDGIDGIKGVSEMAPNFYMPAYGSRMTSTIYVRGLGTRIEQPAVALNIDNVPMINKDNYDMAMPDISSVSVTRGAQSIDYGRNSMAGVINITTLSPLDYQGLRAMVEYGTANTWRAQATLYTMPSPTLGIAVTASGAGTDGHFRNDYTGHKVDHRTETLEKVRLDWRPNNRWQLSNSLWMTYTRQGGYPYEWVETGRINHNDTCSYRRLSVIDGLTVNYTGKHVTLASITSMQYLNDDMKLDQDFMPQDYFTLQQKRHEWSLTQDFVAKGRAGAYGWMVGAFGFVRRTNMSAPVHFLDYGIKTLIEDNANPHLPTGMSMAWDERDMLLASDFVIPNGGVAAYHKSTLTLGDLCIDAALRLAFERTSLHYRNRVNTSYTMYRAVGPNTVPISTVPINIDNHDRLHQTSLRLLPQLRISYRLCDDLRIGGVVAKGYKAGGYNTQMFSDILQQQIRGNAGLDQQYSIADIISYKPEYSWNYELSAALTALDRRLSIEASLFLISCRDQQMTTFPDGQTTGRMMTNAGRTRSMGVEVSAAYSPSDAWRFNAAYGMADARFRRFNDGTADYRGNHVPYAPANTLYVGAAWIHHLNASVIESIEISANCRGVGRIWWTEANDVVQPFYALVGAEMAVNTSFGQVKLWANNITGTRYSTFYFESMGRRFTQRGNPFTMGVTLRYDLNF